MGPPALIFVVTPPAVRLPGRYATMAELAWVFQRAALDRPVVDRTGLAGRYDFDLEFTPDRESVRRDAGRPPSDAPLPGLFAAIQQQLGLVQSDQEVRSTCWWSTEPSGGNFGELTEAPR